MPFHVARKIILSLTRSSTSTRLPYINDTEAIKLAARERQLFLYILDGSSVHPNLALYCDWEILTLVQQRQIALQSTIQGMEAYHEDSQLLAFKQIDLELSNRQSWGKKIIDLKDGMQNKDQIGAIRMDSRILRAQLGEERLN
jgi:hypothetical protein